MTSKDLDKAVDTFAQSTNLMAGIQEEFAILELTTWTWSRVSSTCAPARASATRCWRTRSRVS